MLNKLFLRLIKPEEKKGPLCLQTLPLWHVLAFFLAGQLLLGLLVYLANGPFFLKRQYPTVLNEKNLAYFQQLVAANPSSPLNQTNLGLAYFRLGRYHEAINHLQQAVEIDGAYLPAYLAAGHVYAAAGQKEDALNSFKQAIGLSPKDFRGHLYAGIVLRELGRFAESAKALEKARALQPAGSDIYVELGLTYEAWGKVNAAKDTYKRALELNPVNETANKALARLATSGSDN